ncbi:hypothetical protein [Ornithinicoccus halotolerans]|uniref:hypothetical protein n=1 Tax=Ornithinicoccus halotolerans TaxID=1748220 RepID=UPI00129809E1|nr:hypothetical protein [Ornithinicoccus halotolerans]
MTEPEVVAALASDEESVRRGLLPWVRRAIASGEVRSDLRAERVVAWVQALLGGYPSRLSVDESFDAVRERDALLDAIRRLIRA